MITTSPSPVDPDKSEWQKIESIFAALYNVPRDKETLKKDEDTTHCLIASWNAYGLWEDWSGDGRSSGIALEATASGEPLLRASVYAEDDELIDVVYEGRSLEAAVKALASERHFSEQYILHECRRRLQRVQEKIEQADGAALG